MGRRNAIVKAVLVLVIVWAAVWGIRAYAGSRKITAERVNREVAAAHFADWSKEAGNAVEAQRREKALREIAGLVNRLDFQEREKNRDNRTGENFFRLLSPSEKGLFINLSVAESMNSFMKALDAMKPAERKHFVEEGLKNIQNGRTKEDMARTDAMSDELLEKISQEGMRAYFEKSNADTKLDLAPLMDAMNDTMQGLRGNQFVPHDNR
jgi:hypothetical protein